MLYLSFFGTPTVRYNDQPLEFSRKKAMAILIYLAIQTKPQSREKLASMFWPDMDASKSRASFRQNLSVLNRTPLKNYLDVDLNLIKLDKTSDIWVDTDKFQKLIRAYDFTQESTSGGSDYKSSFNSLRQAIDLYSGDFLSGFTLGNAPEFDEWQFFEVEKYRNLMISSLNRLILTYSEVGEFDEGIALCRKWLSIDPTDEMAYRNMMILFDRSGQRNAALYQFQQCQHILKKELDIEPSSDTVKIYEAIRQGKLKSVEKKASKPVFHGHSDQFKLPKPVSPFFGRDEELCDIKSYLQDKACRLITLLGSGGVGKTRLATYAAKESMNLFPDGIFFISMIHIETERMILHAIAQAIQYQFDHASDATEELCRFLSNKKILLILDNFEHLIEDVHVISELLSHTQELKMIITSRVRLQLYGEWSLNVQGFPVPQKVLWEDYSKHAPISLFINTAQRVKPNVQFNDEDMVSIVGICEWLDGVPLAIELAASLIRVLPVDEIIDEIKKDIESLKSTFQDIPERLRSIEAVYDYSYRLLSPAEQQIFIQCAVFIGGMSRTALQYVTQAQLEDLIHIIDHSLLYRDNQGRLFMHELTRQYACKLLRSNEQLFQNTKNRHASYYLNYLYSRTHSEPLDALDADRIALDSEKQNIIMAWEWFLDRRDISNIRRYIINFARYFDMKGAFGEGKRAIEKTIETLQRNVTSLEDITLEGLLLYYLGFFQSYVGEYLKANENLENCITLLNGKEYRYQIFNGLKRLTHNCLSIGDLDRAAFFAQKGMQMAKESSDKKFMALFTLYNGYIRGDQGELNEARDIIKSSLNQFKTLDMPSYAAMCSNALGYIYMLMGDTEKAKVYLEKSLSVKKALLKGQRPVKEAKLSVRKKYSLSGTLCDLGSLALKTKDPDSALLYFVQVLDIAKDVQSASLALFGIQGMAGYYLLQKNFLNSINLAQYVLNHAASDEEAKRYARKWIEEAQAYLPDEEHILLFDEKYHHQDWWIVVKEIILGLKR